MAQGENFILVLYFWLNGRVILMSYSFKILDEMSWWFFANPLKKKKKKVLLSIHNWFPLSQNWMFITRNDAQMYYIWAFILNLKCFLIYKIVSKWGTTYAGKKLWIVELCRSKPSIFARKKTGFWRPRRRGRWYIRAS